MSLITFFSLAPKDVPLILNVTPESLQCTISKRRHLSSLWCSHILFRAILLSRRLTPLFFSHGQYAWKKTICKLHAVGCKRCRSIPQWEIAWLSSPDVYNHVFTQVNNNRGQISPQRRAHRNRWNAKGGLTYINAVKSNCEVVKSDNNKSTPVCWRWHCPLREANTDVTVISERVMKDYRLNYSSGGWASVRWGLDAFCKQHPHPHWLSAMRKRSAIHGAVHCDVEEKKHPFKAGPRNHSQMQILWNGARFPDKQINR